MKIGYKELITFAIPYFMAVAVCHQLGYWGSFNINVLEFVSFTDIAKLAVYPILGSVVLFFIATSFLQIIAFQIITPGVGSKTKIAGFLKRFWLIFFILDLLFILFLYVYYPEPGKWVLIACFFSFLSAGLINNNFISELIPSFELRTFLLLWATLLPILAFAFGKIDAFSIKDGHPKKVIVSDRSNLKLSSDEKNEVAYLGYLSGNHVFYESKTGQIIFFKQKDETLLFLKPMNY